jgi:hypothetical protein
MSFRDLDEFFDDSLRLPMGGKVYVVPPVDATTGLRLQRMLGVAAAASAGASVDAGDLAALNLGDDDERDLYEKCLGTAYDEMLADGVSWPRIRHAGITAFMWAAGNRELAESVWNTPEGGPGKAPRQPQDRKTKATRAGRPASAAGKTRR